MMEISLKWLRFYLCLLFLFLQLCNGNPISPNDTETDSHAKLLTGVISLLLTVCSLVFLAACLCCQRRKRFEQFRNSPVTASSISDLDHGHVNPIANGEFTIFSPLSTHYNNNVFHANETKTKAVEDPLANSYDISSWFGPGEKDFPRTRLKYIKELGSGWFGKVVEGAVQDVDNKGQSWSPVVVRILETTSSQKEKILFLQNAAIYRTGGHANILSLVGKSLETVPYLLLQEYCPQGDLKVYLKSQKANAEQFLSTDYPLLWCHQLTSALKHLHEHDIVHSDLASRNCQLTSTLQLKLGDYGLGPFKYPSDYYQGQPAVPVRWCAPESLVCTHTTIQPKRLTPEDNVWSLAVTMWEICECGEQPYWSLTDDEVISQVLGAAAVRLERPTCSVLYTDYIFRLMQLCWTSAESRPKVLQLHIMLTDLLQVHRNTSSSDTLNVDEFDRRWASCKPNTIIKTDHISESILSNDERENGTKSLSLSLTNLHGSLDNLNFGDMDNSTNEQSKSMNRYDIFQRTSSGSETEEENWKLKVERGAYTEKVRQKSRSVADLMVLTHVDYSESESETPLQSLEYRVNYKNVRLAGLDGGNHLENTSLTFGSEGNLLSVQDTFKEELRKLQEERRDSLPFVPDNVSQSSFRNSEVAASPSRLIQELNSSSELKPANQIFNIYNVTVDNYSPIRVNTKLSNILDVNSQLKPEWREVDKLSEINSELNQEISKLERLKEIHKVDSGLSTASSSDLNQESEEAGASGNHSVNCMLQPDIGIQNVQGNFTSMEVNPDLIKELVQSEKSVPDIICQSKPKSWEIDHSPRRNQPSNQSNTLDLIGVVPRQAEPSTSYRGTEKLASTNHEEVAEAANVLDINFSVPEILDNTRESDVDQEIKEPKTSNLAEISKEDAAEANLSLKEIQQFQQLSRWVDSPITSLDTTTDSETLKNVNKTDVNGVLQTDEHTEDINAYGHINSNVTDGGREDGRLDIPDVEMREVDCKNVIKANEGSETCDNIDENLTFDVVRGLDSVVPNESVCETFNFDVKVENSVLSNLQDDSNSDIGTSSITETERNTEKENETRKVITENYENNLILNKKLIEDNIVTIIEEIIAQSLQEVSSKCAHEIKDVNKCVEKNESLDVSDIDQVVNFDLSLNQEEAMPNSLTHSNLFTCSTPFNKKSMEHKFSSVKFEESLGDYVPDNKDLNYSLETWDNFLGSTLDHQNQHPENLFDSFSSEPRSLLFIEGQEVDEACDIDQTRVVSKDATYCKEGNKTYNCDDKEKGDTVNTTYYKGEPGSLGVYSGEVWSNFFTPTSDYSNLHSDTQFDEFSSEPQSLIFIESEGVYKTCDNVDDANKKVRDEAKNGAKDSTHYTAKPGTSKDFRTEENGGCVGDIDTRVGALNSTYSKEDNLLNSTYTLNENNLKEPTLEGLTDLNEGSFENGGGWFLHPQPAGDLSGEIQVQSPSTDTYVGFGIDDEIMSAIRNELLTKLPHAQGNNTDKVKEEDEWDTLERNEVFLRYNVYNTPLSPIPEESLIEDVSGTTSPRHEKELDDGDWSGRTDTDTLTHEVESTSAHTLESPVRGPLNRHTPSQDSCCSNDTLFNLEDLVCGITDIERDRDSPLNVNVEEISSEDAAKSDIDEKSVKNESSGAEDSMESNTKPQEINRFLSTERSYSAVVPLPSPEENPWKQLPASLLNYNQLSLSNTPLIKEEDTKSEDSNNCDTLPKTEIGDDDDADTLRTDSIEQDEESENNNITFNQTHPQILDLAVTVEPNTQNEDVCCSKEKDVPTSDQETSDKENIEPLYQNSEVKDTALPNLENEKANKVDDHLYENSNIKDTERLYQNLEPNLDPFDDYVNIVNMENNKNRLESDLLDKDHTYINTYEPVEKDDDDSIYGLLTDIRFTGPADSQMMSTSFSENNDEQGWESGSDSRSSSSGEFIWREGEHEESLKALRAAPQDVLESITPMEGIAEDNFEESDLSSNFSDDEESPEFVPSAWDKFAMPSKSALRSPEKTLKKREEQKPKGVWFKKQKYHCIYEYPKEPESPVLANQDVWKQPEFKVFTDSPTNSNMSEDFFITSSTQPFDTHNLSSQFFPGSSSWNFDNVTPDSGMEDITPGSISDANEFETSTIVPTLKQLASDVINRKKTSKVSGGDVLGGLRHTRKLLKLDLPPSPSAFTSDKLFTVEPTVEPVVREKPSFTTFGKSRFMVQHVDTPDEVKGKNVSFEALPYKPNSPLVEKVSLVLDDLKHLPDKFDFVERNLIKNEYDTCKTKVEVVRGEASLLDSGDEDSGIESTSTLERKLSNPEV